MEELSAAAPPQTRLGRVAQQVLAATLTLGALAYAIGLTRAVGLVVFPEQFLAAAYGVCLALLFVSFPVTRGTQRTIVFRVRGTYVLRAVNLQTSAAMGLQTLGDDAQPTLTVKVS